MKRFWHLCIGACLFGIALGLAELKTNTWEYWVVLMTVCIWYSTKPNDES